MTIDKKRRQYILYMVFAVLCISINLGSQSLVSRLLINEEILKTLLFGFTLHYMLKLATGTILGFAAKFLLDKFIVFKEKQEKLKHTIKQFFIYGLLAVAPTIIFWTSESVFRKLFHSDKMDFVGGLIGLAIGYTLKFFMDKKFVFKSNEETAPVTKQDCP